MNNIGCRPLLYQEGESLFLDRIIMVMSFTGPDLLYIMGLARIV